MQYPILNMDKDLSFVAYRIFVEVLPPFSIFIRFGHENRYFRQKITQKLLYSLKIEILY